MSETYLQTYTTPRTLAEIKASLATLTELVERCNTSVANVRKWWHYEMPENLFHRTHALSTLTAAQEAIVAELSSLVSLTLGDWLVSVREFLHQHTSRSGLDRCLRRHGVANMSEVQTELGCVDRANRWVFLRRLYQVTLIKFYAVLTGNSSQFTDRFTSI